MKNSQNKITWYTLGFMCFSTLWGFGNIVNGFVYYDGTRVIFSWILMFVLYFIPYALMVGELGSAFKDKGGGVTSWIQETTGPKLAYYAGWTYWAVHITYIASKGSGGLKALSWIVFRNAETFDSFPTIWIQLATLAIFLFFCWFATKGINPLKKLATIAGSSTFVMSLLYIVMMIAAPKIVPNPEYIKVNWDMSALVPVFNARYFLSLSVLVFAVGGAEKISPYVNKVEDSAKGFPKGIIFAALMVVSCAIFGTIAMSRMFDPAVINSSEEMFNAYAANGGYWAFQKLGEYYHVGNLFMIVYAASNVISQFAVLLISIDAPLRMLLDDENARQFIPKKLLVQNENGAYTNGIKMVSVLSGSIILIQILVPSAPAVMQQLIRLNAVCMPLRYLWVFYAYMMLKKCGEKFKPEYKFVKSKTGGMIIGGWCFLVTAACCIMGMVSDDPITLVLNIVTPIVLISLGLILPIIRKKQDEAELLANTSK